MNQQPIKTYPHSDNVIAYYWRDGKPSFEITVYDAKAPGGRKTICAPTLQNLKLQLALRETGRKAS